VYAVAAAGEHKKWKHFHMCVFMKCSFDIQESVYDPLIHVYRSLALIGIDSSSFFFVDCNVNIFSSFSLHYINL